MKSQKRYSPVYSCEFFPPKSEEGRARLRDTWGLLAKLGPKFFSVTYGAGGSTQERTIETVVDLQRESGIEAAPHVSCIGSTRDSIRGLLETYRSEGIRHIVALRGDMPSGMQEPGEFSYANELVAFLRAETGSHFHVEVAAYPEFHPQARNAAADLENFKRKVQAGADSAITQYFFNPEAYFRFVDSCEAIGLDLPIVPGIMPVTNFIQLARFSDACGAEIPRWLRKRLESYGDDLTSIRALGLDVVTDLCAKLLAAGAPGLHFYTMNKASPTTEIWKNLGL